MEEEADCRYPNRSSLLGLKLLTRCLWNWGGGLYKILYRSHKAEVLVAPVPLVGVSTRNWFIC